MTDEALVRLVDELETRAAGYLTLDEIERAAGAPVAPAIEAGLLLVDHRERFDPETATFQPITLCRLNRHHALVQRLTGW